MPLSDYLTYQAGFVPRHDVDAQTRCFEYLKATIADLENQKREHPDSQNLKNLIKMFQDLESVTDVAAGSMRLDRANTFWRYWDKNKRRIIQLKEGTNDDYDIQDKLSELEEGRYVQE